MAKRAKATLGEGERELFVCPECRNKKMFRVKRTYLERIVSIITFGKAADKKYFCSHCNRPVFTNKRD